MDYPGQYECRRCRMRHHLPEDDCDRFCSFCRLFADEVDTAPAATWWKLEHRTVRQLRDATQVGGQGTTGRRPVDMTEIRRDGDEVGACVTTEFLPVAPCVHWPPQPLLFETFVMCNATARIFDELHRHYRTWDEAVAGHAAVLACLQFAGWRIHKLPQVS